MQPCVVRFRVEGLGLFACGVVQGFCGFLEGNMSLQNPLLFLGQASSLAALRGVATIFQTTSWLYYRGGFK